MFGFEKGNSNEGVQKELERAQAEKLMVMREPDSAQKEGKLQALNDIIANLQEQIGTRLETATESAHIEESAEDVNIDSVSEFIARVTGRELTEDDATELAEHTKTLLAAQSMKPDSQRIKTALVLLSDIRTKNEGRGA